MLFDLNTVFEILTLCAKTFTILHQFQIITGIDVIPLFLNNQLSVEMLQIIINTVNTFATLNVTSEISLADQDLWELLRYAIQESGNTNIVSAEILDSLGLYTNSIIAYLNSFGYSVQ